MKLRGAACNGSDSREGFRATRQGVDPLCFNIAGRVKNSDVRLRQKGVQTSHAALVRPPPCVRISPTHPPFWLGCSQKRPCLACSGADLMLKGQWTHQSQKGRRSVAAHQHRLSSRERYIWPDQVASWGLELIAWDFRWEFDVPQGSLASRLITPTEKTKFPLAATIKIHFVGERSRRPGPASGLAKPTEAALP